MTTTTQPTHTTSTGSKLATVVAGYRARRSARALRSRIELEIASYRTPAEIQELDAIVERSGEELDPVYTQVIEQLRLRVA